jgi:outer membrane protein
VDENLTNRYNPDRTNLLQKMLNQNGDLLSLQKNAEIASAIVEETRTLGKPRITLNGQFNALRTDNGAGFLRNNTQAGILVGGAFVMPLYTGGNLKRQVGTARVGAEQAVLRVDAQRAALEADLDNQLAFFQNQGQVLVLEEENVKNARESLAVSTERFRLGQTNALEVQTAQNTLEQALARRNLVLFNLKASEIQLRLLAAEL